MQTTSSIQAGERTQKLTARQGAIIGAFTGVLSGEFSDMHAYIEEKMGRPVWTHEMGDKAIAAQIKEVAREDFFSILPI